MTDKQLVQFRPRIAYDSFPDADSLAGIGQRGKRSIRVGTLERFRDVHAIKPASGDGYASDITVMGTLLYFQAGDCCDGFELWMMEIEHTITYR